ncbi:MAG: M23 family metallopeptidase [Chloroflexi bacterium]|nr:M23 family metallopeptidase [Chloroflexota bacterium]
MMKRRALFLRNIFFLLWLIFIPACARTGGDASINNGNTAGSAPNRVNLLPDSELVYGTGQVGFDVTMFIQSSSGYLAGYSEEVEGRTLNGAQIVEEVSLLYSVNPRLLLALLEYRSDWVTVAEPAYQGLYPINPADTSRAGLFTQLSWAANELNRGFYTHEVGALGGFALPDGTQIDLDADMNDASAAVQYLFALFMDYHDWELAVSPLGFYADYVRLFGDPFQYDSGEPLPVDLAQPPMQLPFAAGERWHYTSGAHSAWGDGAAWAAIDLAPPGENWGCYQSEQAVRAVAEGVISYAENGAVLQDLSGDGDVRTGWVVLYMHISSTGRAAPGSVLQAGEVIGYASCEGGYSSGTHLHLARRYNGEWVAADRDVPFVLSGWISAGSGSQYEGTLSLNNTIVEASEYLNEENEINW